MMDNDLTPRILLRAYEIWEGEGRPHGRDKAHWFMAEAELASSDRQPGALPSKTERKARSTPKNGNRRSR